MRIKFVSFWFKSTPQVLFWKVLQLFKRNPFQANVPFLYPLNQKFSGGIEMNIDLRWVSEPERVKIKLTKNQELLTRIKVTSNKPQMRRSHLKWVFYKKVSPNKLIIRFWWLQGGLIQEGEKLIHNQNQETKSWDDPSLVWIVSITILILFVTVSITRN